MGLSMTAIWLTLFSKLMSAPNFRPIALYAYAHLAHACDYDLTTFPEIRAWLERVATQPGYVSMDWQPENVVAAE